MKVLYHTLIWGALICVLLLLGQQRPPENNHHVALSGYMLFWSVLPCILLFYFHGYWLMPKYLFRKKKWTYVLLVMLAILISSLISSLVFHFRYAHEQTFLRVVMMRIMPNVAFVLASVSIGALAEKDRLEKERKEKETAHLRTELAFLRGQVNPHFMLNVLNSMVLMARKRSELLEPALLELAGLMSYMLYQTDNEKIRLEDEIAYLRVYIDLQMLRFKDDVVVHFNPPAQPGDQLIEPMLLIPIVENAFKHGIGLVNDPFINIDMWIHDGNALSISVINRYNPAIRETTKKGIGLINLRKRLDLIYPGQYRMEIVQDEQMEEEVAENRYLIHLNIPLQ